MNGYQKYVRNKRANCKQWYERLVGRLLVWAGWGRQPLTAARTGAGSRRPPVAATHWGERPFDTTITRYRYTLLGKHSSRRLQRNLSNCSYATQEPTAGEMFSNADLSTRCFLTRSSLFFIGRSKRSCSLRHEISLADQTLQSWVRILLKAWKSAVFLMFL
jgi:hypothetical protein